MTFRKFEILKFMQENFELHNCLNFLTSETQNFQFFNTISTPRRMTTMKQIIRQTNERNAKINKHLTLQESTLHICKIFCIFLRVHTCNNDP